jgi:hypothetical protein
MTRSEVMDDLFIRTRRFFERGDMDHAREYEKVYSKLEHMSDEEFDRIMVGSHFKGFRKLES